MYFIKAIVERLAFMLKKPDQIDDNFIKGLTRSLMDNINIAIEERNKENVNE